MSSSFLQILFLGALWGAAFMFMRVAVPEFGAFSMALARVAMAAVIMLAIVAALRQSIHFRARWKTYLAVGAINTALPFIAYSFAAKHIPAGYSAIANSTTPVWSALITWLWFKQPLGAAKWIGIVFAFAGVFVLVGLQPVALTPLVIAGMVAAVLAASMYAAASFLIQRYLTGESGLPGAAGMLWGATMWLIAPGIFYAPDAMPSVNAWGAVLALSVLCTVLGYGMFFHLIKTIGPQRASSVAFLFPAFAAFWGWLILSEPITFNMIAGMALVLAGTALVSDDSKLRAEKTGAATTWERLRDWILWPLLYTFAPDSVRRTIARRIMRGDRYFREETQALRANISDFLPDADLQHACEDHRLMRFTDRADVFLSTFRMQRTLERDIVVASLPPVEHGTMILFAHYGNGWWTLPVLAAQGKPVSLISAPLPPATTWRDWLWRPYVRLRWREMNRLGGAPLITMHGASKIMLENLRQGGRGLAAIDIPSVLAKRTSPVQFFGRTAYMPRRAIEIAQEAGAQLWVFFSEVDRATQQQHIRMSPISLAGGVDEAFNQYASMLEQAIRTRPGLWHAWGDAPLYFRQS
jgi:drug/metabolite transporter (DMT)-like permease